MVVALIRGDDSLVQGNVEYISKDVLERRGAGFRTQPCCPVKLPFTGWSWRGSSACWLEPDRWPAHIAEEWSSVLVCFAFQSIQTSPWGSSVMCCYSHRSVVGVCSFWGCECHTREAVHLWGCWSVQIFPSCTKCLPDAAGQVGSGSINSDNHLNVMGYIALCSCAPVLKFEVILIFSH